MISVTRTRLDTGAIAVTRATRDDLKIAIDARHITAAGASALEQVLNGLTPPTDPEACERGK
ncbi:hypothetical protein ACWCQL_01580 [Streptomyces sp. NPDC002073]